MELPEQLARTPTKQTELPFKPKVTTESIIVVDAEDESTQTTADWECRPNQQEKKRLATESPCVSDTDSEVCTSSSSNSDTEEDSSNSDSDYEPTSSEDFLYWLLSY